MKVKLKETIKPTKEELTLLRFSLDNEAKKIQIEAVNKIYSGEELIGSEPIRLLIREEEYEKAKSFCFNDIVYDKILHLILRKLEVSRKLKSGTLCEPMPFCDTKYM